MKGLSTDELIAALGADADAVNPLPSPLRRALLALGTIALFGAAAILLLSGQNPIDVRPDADRAMLALELLAMLGTGGAAVVAAFHLSIPGRSRRWLAAPFVPFALWLLLSGAGCYRDFVRNGPTGWEIGHSLDCLIFILGASVLVGTPLLWRLSRAAPIDPLPVALLGGLGTAAFSAFLLAFFHPFAVTFIDLAVHLAAILIVVALAALLKKPMLRSA